MQELETFYVDLVAGRTPSLPEPKLQYRDFALWQQNYLKGAEAQAHLAYWRQQLEGATEHPTGFRLDRQAPARPTQRAATLNPEVPASLLRELRKLSVQERKTLFMVLLAGIKGVLHRRTGQTDLTVLSLYANRHLAEIEPVIGSFYTLLPLRTRLKHATSFRELLASVQEVTLAAYTHASALPDEVLRALWSRRGDAEPSISRILFALQNLPALNRDFGGLKIRVVPMDSRRIRFDTSYFFYEGADDLFIRLRYNTDLFDETTVRRWHEDFVALLEAATRHPGATLGDLLPS